MSDYRLKRPVFAFLVRKGIANREGFGLGANGLTSVADPLFKGRDFSVGQLLLAGGHFARFNTFEEQTLCGLAGNNRRARVAAGQQEAGQSQVEGPFGLVFFAVTMPAMGFQNRADMRFKADSDGGWLSGGQRVSSQAETQGDEQVARDHGESHSRDQQAGMR